MPADARSEIMSSLSSSPLCSKDSSCLSFEELEKNIYLPFIDLFVAELKDVGST